MVLIAPVAIVHEVQVRGEDVSGCVERWMVLD